MTIRSLLNNILGLKNNFRLRYFRQRLHWPDFDQPKDYSEILISRILSDRFNDYAQYADKVKVRDFVISKGLGDTLLEHYGHFDSIDEIKPDALPDKFALKTNRGASAKDVCICTDKSSFDWDRARKRLKKGMEHRYEYESHYNLIVPQIICEELIDTGDGSFPTDYKFTCVKGEIIEIFVCTERETGKPCHCSVDMEWNRLPYIRKKYLPSYMPQKPKHLTEMEKIAKRLSEDFEIVRVDLYEYKDKVYFSELTFSPLGGILYPYNRHGIIEMGKKINEILSK